MEAHETNAGLTEDQAAANRPMNDYEMGFCKPPKEHQFKPGNNANPRGRKKGSRNRRFVITEVLFDLISVREGDKVKKISVIEAILKKTVNKALTGDHKAALTIIGIAQKEKLLTPARVEYAPSWPNLFC